MNTLPKITIKQTNILNYLYKFYFLSTNQLQKLLNHKKPQRIQKWLKDLKDKNYIDTYDFKVDKFKERSEPNVYYLTKLARLKLMGNEKYDLGILNRAYRVRSLTPGFIINCLFLADIYLNLLSQMKKGEKLHFSTVANLQSFDFLPDPLPDAYIAVKTVKRTRRSFLILLRAKISWKILDQRMINYVQYSYTNRWADYSSDPLPTFLIICPNETTKRHLYKTVENESPSTPFYLTTKETIQKSGFKGDIWEKVDAE